MSIETCSVCRPQSPGSEPVKVGDEVEWTVTRSGTIIRIAAGSAGVQCGAITFNVPLSDLTVIAPPLPEEPPTKTVMMDRHGIVAQSYDQDRWCRVGDARIWSWRALNESVGPLTLLVPQDGAR